MTKSLSLSVVAFDALRDKGKSLGGGIQYSLELLSDSRLLEQLPFVGQLLSLNEGLLSMSDRLFVDKFIEFLRELDAADEQNRKQLANKLLADSGSQERAGRLLLHYLNSLDSPEKSKLAGKIAAACARGEISFHEMKRHFSILTKVYLPDLDELKDVSEEQYFST